MPQLTKDEFLDFIKELDANVTQITMRTNKETEELALKESESYLNGTNDNVNEMNPFSLYYIIKNLDSKKQITFIKKYIDYIKKHDNEIFLFDFISPKSLSYYLSFEVIKELKNIDYNLFKKIINGNPENLFLGFTHEDYLNFYKEFLKDIDNDTFVNGIYYHNRCLYKEIKVDDINDIFEKQRKCNREFIKIVIENCKEKINNLDSRNLLNFIQYIEDIEIYKEFVKNNYEKINIALKEITEYRLEEYLSETNLEKQEILIENFFENIIKKQNIKKIIHKISIKIVLDLYKKNNELFNELTLKDFIKISSQNRYFDEEIKSILDKFKITNIEELFDTAYYVSNWYKEDTTALSYIELKYRNSIISNGKLFNIDFNTSIFSEEYFKNLCELKELFKNKLIDRSSDVYKKHLTCFIMFLKKQNIINDIDKGFNEIEKLFYKIVMGRSLAVVYEFNNINEITMYNRLGSLEFKVDDFTLEQLEKYNVKHHKQLYTRFENSDFNYRDYKKLTLKLLLMVGFYNANKLLEIDDELPVLEHLVGNVDVKNIKIDKEGNPILNNKLINILFKDNFSRITEMLEDKDNDLYKYFPRIFNEWEMIKLNGKDKSLKVILDFLKSDDVALPPKYYRLKGLFKYIGCGNSIVNETLKLHDEMLKRTESTIPRVVGSKDSYQYEILRLDDLDSLAVGNKTDCCFTVLGNGYTCLHHAVTSTNGRVFVIKKDDEVIAHSWVWRNGDLLCFDNIEISKKIDNGDFLDIYLEAIDKIINTSYTLEGIDNCIKNVTIGFTNFDKEIKGLENYLCLIKKDCDLKIKDFDRRLGKNRKYVESLPVPIEEVGYTDSKNVQYLIRGNSDFNLGQSNYLYQDDRLEVLHYNKDLEYEDNYIEKILRIVNGLRYVKLDRDGLLDKYKNIEIDRITEIYCNEDWYYIEYLNGEVEEFNNSFDDRSYDEIKLQKEVEKVKVKTGGFCENRRYKI